MNFTGIPLHNRVVIKPVEADTKSKGGIIIPDSAKEKPLSGEVVSHGPGTKDDPITVRKGDKVLFSKYAGTEITIEEENYLIMKEADILIITSRQDSYYKNDGGTEYQLISDCICAAPGNKTPGPEGSWICDQCGGNWNRVDDKS